MRNAPRSTFVLVVCLLAVAAASVAASWLAEPAQAAPGSIVWQRTVNATGTGDRLSKTARGPNGSLVAAGQAGSYPVSAMWVVRYSATGKRLWSETWSSAAGTYNYVRDMAVDAAGNVYVCGSTETVPGYPRDAVLVKFGADGSLKWRTTWREGANWDTPMALGLDGDREVYVAGSSDAGTDSEVFVAKFDPRTGVRAWRRPWTGSGNASAWDLHVTAAGDCYVVGSTRGTADGAVQEACLLKVTHAGTYAWARTWGGPAPASPATFTRVAPAARGAMIVGGTTENGTGSDWVVARYTAAGKRGWVKTWGAPGDSSDSLENLAVAADGSVWACGLSRPTTGSRAAVVRWSAAGARRFARVVGHGSPAVELWGLALDAAGNAYVSGDAERADKSWDGYAAKFSPGGRSLWKRYVGSASGAVDDLGGICLGPAGALYAAGAADSDGADPKGMVVKLRR
jgi:hypothetical protein